MTEIAEAWQLLGKGGDPIFKLAGALSSSLFFRASSFLQHGHTAVTDLFLETRLI